MYGSGHPLQLKLYQVKGKYSPATIYGKNFRIQIGLSGDPIIYKFKNHKMEKYLGVKLIEASTEMSRKEYCDYRGWELPKDENGDDRVYLVEYEPEESSKPNHPNHKGYISMSPKDVFEKAYRKILDIYKLIPDLGSDIPEYQQRVFMEAVGLRSNCMKLDQFIFDNENFKTLPTEEQARLKQQLMAMQYYLTILVERIENFK
jgi:hypothetical protein